MRHSAASPCTELGKKACTWFGEIYSCSCLPVLPGPAGDLLSIESAYLISEPCTTYIDFGFHTCEILNLFVGYTTGKVIKSQKDRQDYIDDFYAAHPDAPRPLSRYNSSTVYTASSPQQHTGRMDVSATSSKHSFSFLLRADIHNWGPESPWQVS